MRDIVTIEDIAEATGQDIEQLRRDRNAFSSVRKSCSKNGCGRLLIKINDRYECPKHLAQ